MKKQQVRKYKDGGSGPYITHDPRDPRIQAHNDSVAVYNSYLNTKKALKDNKYYTVPGLDDAELVLQKGFNMVSGDSNKPSAYRTTPITSRGYYVGDMHPASVNTRLPAQLYNPNIEPSGVDLYGEITPHVIAPDYMKVNSTAAKLNPLMMDVRQLFDYSNAKPKQQVIYQPNPITPIPKKTVVGKSVTKQIKKSVPIPTVRSTSVPAVQQKQSSKWVYERYDNNGVQRSVPMEQPIEPEWFQPTKQQYGGNINTQDMKKNKNAPCMNCGGSYHMEMGGNPPGMYWDGKKYVKAKGTGTYNNGVYFQQGGPAYYPPKQYPGYYKPYAYIEDGGNMGELQYGGYIPAPAETKPHVLQQTNGTYHMSHGGYIPASINTQPHILPYSDGRYHMQYGGGIGDTAVYNGVYTARPGAPIRKYGGVLNQNNGDYWRTNSFIEDGGNITEIQYGGPVMDTDDPTPEYGKGGPSKKNTLPSPMDRMDYIRSKYPSLNGASKEYLDAVQYPLEQAEGLSHRGYYELTRPGMYTTEGTEPGENFVNKDTYGPPDRRYRVDPQTLRPYINNRYVDYEAMNKPQFEYIGQEPEEFKKGGNWIPKNLKKGRCTPAPNPDCPVGSPQYNLAQTFKKHHGFQKKQYGGPANPFHPLAQYAIGGFTPDPNGPTEDEVASANAMYTPGTQEATNMAGINTGVVQQPDAPWRAGMTDQEAQANINEGGTMNPDGSYGPQQPQGPTGRQKFAAYANAGINLLGAGLMTASQFAQNKSQRDTAAYNRSLGMSSNMPTYTSPGSKGDYNQQGYFRPGQQTPTNAGYYSPNRKYGGPAQYEHGGEYHMDSKEIARLRKLGYQIEEL